MKHRSQISSNDCELPDQREIDISSNVPLGEEELSIASSDMLHDERLKNLLKEEAELRAFMEEPVTFDISQTTDVNAPDPVPAGVQGIIKHFKRGVEYTVPRKFIDSLIKVTNKVKTINYKDENNVDQTKIELVPSLVYPINIINDPSGAVGRRWFLHQQKNAF